MGSFFVVPAKTPHKQGIIFPSVKLFDLRFHLHLRNENSIPTPFWNLILGFLFTNFEVWVLFKKKKIWVSSDSELTANCPNVLSLLKWECACDLSKSLWQEPFKYKHLFYSALLLFESYIMNVNYIMTDHTPCWQRNWLKGTSCAVKP